MSLLEVHYKPGKRGNKDGETRYGYRGFCRKVEESDKDGDSDPAATNPCDVRQCHNYAEDDQTSNLQPVNWKDVLVRTYAFLFDTALKPWMVQAVLILCAPFLLTKKSKRTVIKQKFSVRDLHYFWS